MAIKAVSLARAAATACLVAGVAAAASGAQQGPSASGTPSVDVRPEGTGGDDPNAGQWFVATAEPGATLRFRARLLNPASVAQTVRLSLADLEFDDEGTPTVAARSDDIGTWGAPDRPEVTLPAGGQEVVGFSVTVPEGAEPGDHVGAFVAESLPEGRGDVRVVKQVATRLYVTVPGDANPGVEIVDVDVDVSDDPLRRVARITITLRNTGNIRLSPRVLVNGKHAGGPPLLVSRSTEPYRRMLEVPIWSGPQQFRIDVDTEVGGVAGPSTSRTVRVFLWPLLLLFLLLIAIPLLFLASNAWRRRRHEQAAERARLEAEVRRLEDLVDGAGPAGVTTGSDGAAARSAPPR